MIIKGKSFIDNSESNVNLPGLVRIWQKGFITDEDFLKTCRELDHNQLTKFSKLKK